jgi:hypothetical protein
MATESTKRQSNTFFTVEVFDPHGQKSVFLEGLRASATVSEIRSRAINELALSDGVEWNIRHERTGRLLRDDQKLGEFSELSSQVTLKMQPDASLG